MEQNQIDIEVDNKTKVILKMVQDYLTLTARMYVFEPNDKNTWAAIKSEAINLLHDRWKKGELKGDAPHQAYDVQIGLGATMTKEDVDNGILKVVAKLAITEPGQFHEISFQQEMEHK